MNKSKSLAILVAIASLAAIPTASAQNVTCDNANFSTAVMDLFAGIRNSCLAIVERNGEPHALLNAEVTHVMSPNLTVKFKRRDGGYTNTITFQPAADHVFSVEGGRKVGYKDLTASSQLRVYVPVEGPIGRIGFEVDPMTGELRYFEIGDE
jgi:hypothetical protein